ncbi:FAD-binding oxidoreductase [Micromonospora sp. DT31]|uniref:FAD-binding oxidoreductase n=1 Tax=Micromonospora sp. DT31 TaxID=3393434 RepID=UPI003CE8300D
MNPENLAALRATFFGDLIDPDHPEYEVARRVYNGMVDKRPALVARCRGTGDVVAAVRFAVGEDLPIGVRGGGHSVAGHGTCDGGVLVDLSGMRGVHVDPAERTAWVQGGATLGDLDRETQVYGLATPTGQVSATGVAGLTLNGGMGMLQRRFGLTCDNLIAARVVTTTGEVVTASDTEHPDLFWALRGGGGNFGVVVDFQFQLHPVGPMMLAGLVAYPIEQSVAALEFLRDYIADAPEELSADIIFQFAPPLDAIPEQFRGRQVCGIFIRWSGEMEAGWEAIRPLQEFGEPVLNFVGPMPLVAVQSMLDPLNPNGNQHYWTAEFLPEFGTKEMEVVAEIGATLPSRYSIVEVIPFNAAVTRVAPDATAFAHRSESWLIHVLGQWHDAEDTQRCLAWAKGAGTQLRAVGSGDAYLNLLTDDEETDRVRAFWNDDRLDRLARVKAQYDPQNRFRFNHNIPPAS